MRGDNHVAFDENARVLLIIEEVQRTGGDLAIVALVIEKRGNVASLSTRLSFFPNTVHKSVPRRPEETDEASDKGRFWYDSSRSRQYFRYFAPIWRGRNGYPGFYKETREAGNTLGAAVNGIFAEYLRPINE